MAVHSSSNHSDHRRDPSQGGWDTTITKAPDSHKSKHRHHRRSRRKRRKVLKVIGIVLGVILGLALIVGVALMLYINTINSAMSIEDKDGELGKALSDVPVGKPFYTLLMGSDLREYTADSTTQMTDEERAAANAQIAQSTSSRSDVMILLRVDPASAVVTMLSIPRDTPYTAEDGNVYKLNHAYEVGGAAGAVRAVEDVTGVTISHYAEVTGSGLEDLVNLLGGITVDVPVEIHGSTITNERVDLEPGTQRVDGAEALALANFRKVYESDQDYNRQAGARQVASGIINSIRSRPAYEIPGLLVELASCVKTDLTSTDLFDIVSKMGTSVKVYTGSAPYAGDLDPWVTLEGFEATDGHPWLCYVNTAGWDRVLAVVNAGEDPGTIAASYAADTVHYANQPESTWSKGLVSP